MSNKQLSLAQKIRQGKDLILFELVPPSLSQDGQAIAKSVDLVVSFMNKFGVDGVNIPEVIEEKRNGERSSISASKIEPRELAVYLGSSGFKNILINRPVVHLEWEKQRDWFYDTYNNKKLNNYVLVGGESSSVKYPGLGVGATADKLKNEFPDILLGGITIPTRKTEGARVLKKQQAGIEFFTTQIIYEAESIKKFLLDYWKICKENKEEAKMIFLSFAPITSKRDIDLFNWLGVEIPEATSRELITGWLGIGWRSLDICQNILKDVFDFMQKNQIRIPIGLNIGYVNKNNFEFSVIFLEKIAEFYRKNISF